ncbi:MAG: hypothetical protein IKM04_00370 [Clostridia bacterium]|nr:hypothetical protein [Clostridia bacterium]
MSYKVYPVTKTELECSDYEVYVNGEKAELNVARVSAYPFNRRWPGHQRQIEQTELVNFLSMESDEEVELKIIPKVPAFPVRIRPRELEADASFDANGVITVKVTGAAQFTVEPYGRRHALHVFIDPVSDYGVDKAAPNVLYYGPGEHDVGDLHLKSGQTLFIDEGAVVYATVYATHVNDIKILGRGILDHSRCKEKILFEANVENNNAAVSNATREYAVNFLCCKGVKVDGITIRDALIYNINSMSCEDIFINDIKVIGCWRFNSDGIHFANCVRGGLSNSFIRTYDDSICVRGFANFEYDRYLCNEKQEDLLFTCRDILISNCVVWNDWGKNLQVGTETYSNEITNVRFENNKLIHTCDIVLAITLVDNAKIHGITFANTLVEYDDYILKSRIQTSDSDIYEDRYDADHASVLSHFSVSKHFEYSMIKTEEELGYIHDVLVEDLRLYSVQKPAFVFHGNNPNSSCEDITFTRIYWNGEPISSEFFNRQTKANEFTKNLNLI